MPFAVREGIRLYYKVEGRESLPPLLLLNSIGTDMSLWDRVVPLLLPRFGVIRMDTRGHGASDAPAGDYQLSELASDAEAVLDHAGIASVAVAGVSLGGMIAMELALRANERVSALALICTSAKMDRDAWAARVETVRSEGTSAIAEMALGRFLTPTFVDNNPEIAESIRRGIETMSDDGYAGAGAAIRDMDLSRNIGEIGVPTLVVTGSRDVSTPSADHGSLIAAAVAYGKLVELESAHLPPVEVPGALATLLAGFFLSESASQAAEAILLDKGMHNRRRILGDEWVDRSIAKRTEFNGEFQDLITRIAWHEIWGRPGLDERTRRLLVVAITAALGRWEEFRLHVRAGLERDGFTKDELKEVLLQLAIYAGVPAANTGFSEASAILTEIEI